MRAIVVATACLTTTCLAGPAAAAEIGLGGSLDLRISGYNSFWYEFIDSDLPQASNGRESFFKQDHEIVFRFTGADDATGITYGAQLELELDQSSSRSSADWDEAWGFIRGGWGEFRFGNEDAVTDLLAILGHVNNRGTGGLDGDQLTKRVFRLTDSREATKLIYFTPTVAGFRAGVDYAFNGRDSGSFAGTKNDTQDFVTAAVRWQGTVAGIDLGAHAGLASYQPGATALDTDRAYGWQVGGEIGVFGLSFAVGYGDDDEDALSLVSGGTVSNGRDYFINAGVAGEIGNLGVSFAYQYDEFREGQDSYYVLGADMPILPGLAVRGEAAYLDGVASDGFNGILQLRTAW